MNRICFNKKENIRFGYVIAFLLCLLFSGCSKTESEEYIPQAPDYSDSTFWYAEENDKTGKMPTCFISFLRGKPIGRLIVVRQSIMRMSTIRNIGMT